MCSSDLAGRYAYTPELVAPSPLQAPINPFVPRELATDEIEARIEAYVCCAVLAQEAGYDGVEVMGSEGYLINQFICPRTNHRDDAWGGSLENRLRFPVAIVERIREAVGSDFLLIFRLSMIDLVEEGSTFEEVVALGRALEGVGLLPQTPLAARVFGVGPPVFLAVLLELARGVLAVRHSERAYLTQLLKAPFSASRNRPNACANGWLTAAGRAVPCQHDSPLV